MLPHNFTLRVSRPRSLDDTAAGAKALASWLLPIRPRAEGTRDGNAIPQQAAGMDMGKY